MIRMAGTCSSFGAGALTRNRPRLISVCPGTLFVPKAVIIPKSGNADGSQMREIALGLALLLGACASSAAEGQTLCSSAVSAFDGKDLPAIQELLRAAQNVFDELDAQSMEKGEPALKTKLTDKSVEGFIILGHCRQHPTETTYEAAGKAYQQLQSLRHSVNSPVERPAQKQQPRTRARRAFDGSRGRSLRQQSSLPKRRWSSGRLAMLAAMRRQ